MGKLVHFCGDQLVQAVSVVIQFHNGIVDLQFLCRFFSDQNLWITLLSPFVTSPMLLSQTKSGVITDPGALTIDLASIQSGGRRSSSFFLFLGRTRN
jgi:hypothetical protein